MDYYQWYHPLTATPFIQNEYYAEYEPCPTLKPYICCFWGSKYPYIQTDVGTDELVIPDTCMDIIFNYNYTTNQSDSYFVGINSNPFEVSKSNETHNKCISTFGIRFYAWTAFLFSDEPMIHAKDIYTSANDFFPKLITDLESLFFECMNVDERIKIAEKYLLSHLKQNRESHDFNNSVLSILQHKGNISMRALQHEVFISPRQLERLYQTYLGISPKQFTSLIRYQSLWQEMVRNPSLNIHDAVITYGYTDQSHLLKEFKRFHTLNPTYAKRLAETNVAFLQDK